MISKKEIQKCFLSTLANLNLFSKAILPVYECFKWLPSKQHSEMYFHLTQLQERWISFSPTVKFLQHPALPLWEEIGSPAPGGHGSPFLLSDGSLRSRLLHNRVNSRTFFLRCLLLGQTVLHFCIKWWAKGRPGSRLLICRLPYCLTFPLRYLTSFFSPSRQPDLLSFTTFGPCGQPLLSSSFQVSRLYLGQTCLWPLMSYEHKLPWKYMNFLFFAAGNIKKIQFREINKGTGLNSHIT